MVPLVVLPLDPESFLYLNKHLLGSPRGPSWMTLQRDTNTVLCFDCKTGFRHTWNRQSELPATHEWAACLVISFKGPTLPRMEFLNREKDKSCCQLLQYNLDSYMAAYSTALTPTAGSVSLVLIVACLKTHLWQVKELAFGFVPCTPPEMLCAAFRLQAQSCLPSSEARLSPAWLRDRQTLRCVCAKYCLFKCHALGKKWRRRGSLW